MIDISSIVLGLCYSNVGVVTDSLENTLKVLSQNSNEMDTTSVKTYHL